jgi:hypothetical protein
VRLIKKLQNLFDGGSKAFNNSLESLYLSDISNRAKLLKCFEMNRTKIECAFVWNVIQRKLFFHKNYGLSASVALSGVFQEIIFFGRNKK